jgi:hypothetical protein
MPRGASIQGVLVGWLNSPLITGVYYFVLPPPYGGSDSAPPHNIPFIVIFGVENTIYIKMLPPMGHKHI